VTLRPRTLHRASAIVLALFIFLHLLNHLALAAGSDVHLLVMSGLRAIYRSWIGEAVLLLCVGVQIYSGVTLALPRLGSILARRDWQVVSGLYMAVFLAIHVSAILWGRLYFGLDTNLWYGAAGFHVWPWPLFFVPYYGLAIVCFAAHIGYALSGLTGIKALVPAAALGAVAATLIVLLMSGTLVDLQVPTDYLASYR
jgi:succinate dehydrogenase/fumarate reductase cytochrome b subunit